MKYILIIEDEPDVRSNLEDLLTANEYGVVSASDGIEAFEKIKDQLPDLVISDVIMPRMGGHRFCFEFKSIAGTEKIPVVILTSLTDPWDIFKSSKFRIDAYIVKPYDAIQLLSVLNNLLKKSKTNDKEG